MLRKALLWASFVILAVWAAGFLVVPYVAKPLLIRVLEEKFHRPVAIREIHINPVYLLARVNGLTMGERDGGAPFFTVDELYVNLQAKSLWERVPVLEEITIKAPYLRIVRKEDSTYNIADIVEELMKPSEPPAHYSLNNIQLRGGRIEFDDRPKHAMHTVSDLELAIPFLSNLPYATDIYVKPAMAAKVNGAPFRLAGQSKLFSPSRESSVQINISEVDIPSYLKYLPTALKFEVPSARLDAKLTISFMQPTSRQPAVTLSGTVALKAVSLTQGGNTPLLSFPGLTVDIASADIPHKKIVLRRVTLDHPELHLRREKGGGFNLAAVIPNTPEDKGASPAEKTPLSLEVGEIRLSGGVVHFADDTLPQPFQGRVQDLDLTLKNFATEPGKPASVDASFATDAGETIKNSGQLTLTPFSAEGTAQIGRLDLKRYAPYYAGLVRFDVEEGALDVSARYRLGGGGDSGLQVALSELACKLDRLRLRPHGEKDEFLKIGTLSLGGGELDLGRRSLTVDVLTTENGSVMATRGVDGRINLANLTVPSGRSKPAAATKSTAPWQFALKKLSVDGYAAKFQSTTAGKAATLSADAIKIRAENLSTQKNSKAKVDLEAGLGKSGHLLAKGDASMNPLDVNLKVDVKGLALVPLQPYFAEKINVTVTDGTVLAKGDLQLGAAPGGPFKVGFVGDARVERFATIDKATAEDFLKWKSLRFRHVNAATQPALQISIAEVALADFYSRLVVNPDGTFNLQEVLVNEEKAAEAPAKTASPDGETKAGSATSTTPPAPAAGKPRITIARMSLRGGQVNFHDHFIRPNYSADLTGLGGSVTDLSSDPNVLADVALKGRVNNQGQLDINGKINPLAGNLFLDVLAKLTDFELSPLTPYAEKYAGYGIVKGKLSFDVKYHVENRKLSAENHLFLNRLTFGDRVESPTATKLPVLLAVALLKDRSDNIDVNLPISGSLDDPQFSMGGIIVKAIINLIVKAVTAPFTLIANLFAGGQELSHLEFDYGSAALPPDAESKLKSLAKALYDRPGVKLDIAGRADPVNDAEGLKRQALEHKVKAQKLKDLIKEGESVASVEEVTITPDEYPKYLAAAYGQEKIPNKPRYFIGLAKKLPVGDMEALMLANIKVSDEDLRELANRRALGTKDYLVKAGPVESERIYIVAPQAPKPEQEKLKQSRVDFNLGAR